MIVSFIEGFLLGLGAALPLGPINILIMHRALQSYGSALFIGFGAMSADVTYLLLILLGFATFFENPTIITVLGVFGSLFLLYMGLMVFQGRFKRIEAQKSVVKQNVFKSYFQGLVLTLLNPYTVVFWLSVAGLIAAKNLHLFSTLAGMLCAILLWVTLMPYIVHRSKHKLSSKAIYVISILSSALLVGFGVSLLFSLAVKF
jgi:L-lysine exporter family protein LysE/ArgO